MADLLPSTPDTSAVEDAEPRVIGLDSEDADDLIGALSSGTARELLTALHEDPGTPSKLADRVDTSLQNTQYHLEKLEDADVIEVIDTAYSAKGREMNVYAPANQPLVVFAGGEEKSTGLKAALTRLLGAFAVLAGLSVLVQALAGDLGGLFGGDPAIGRPAPGPGEQPVAGNPNNTTTVETTTAATDAATGTVDAAAAGIPPGAAFFVGGALVLAAGFAYWYARHN
ncbi:helix-turn-helix transcriptional regulator [Halorubellus sp. JP-L1]|uniref:ArsR/SmtB family transcription factor n=1 Tax=Halorubellus sp. JP-L1 TaxID=2715753 RepID=UPI00140A2359|nr:helix-turn-helix domain-containing protein [Halorubellus sp. JP-L1]NHN41737.1 helix-turn-helix transcriptional regulator [Halorubellus sp. JP-L1]